MTHNHYFVGQLTGKNSMSLFQLYILYKVGRKNVRFSSFVSFIAIFNQLVVIMANLLFQSIRLVCHQIRGNLLIFLQNTEKIK